MRYLVAFVVAALALGAWGQPELNPFVQLIPELKTMAAPAWVKEGVRLEYYSAATSTGLPVDEPNPGGHGYTQVDIVALDATHAILNVRSLGLVNQSLLNYAAGQAAVPIGSQPGIGIPAAGGDWWLHPKALQMALAKGGDDQTSITKMPYTAAGKTYNTVRFQYDAPDGGARLVSVYDLDTGILITNNNRVGPAEGKRMLSQATFLGMRQIAYPWLNATPPAWVATAKGLSGRFAQQVSTPFSAPLVLGPVPVTGKVTARGARWLTYDLDTTTPVLPGMPSSPIHLNVVAGIAQIGLFLPPVGLQALEEDQVIDEDEVVGSTLTVTAVENTGAGTVVTITETAPGFTVVTQYDAATGKLLLSRTMKPSQYLTEQVVVNRIE